MRRYQSTLKMILNMSVYVVVVVTLPPLLTKPKVTIHASSVSGQMFCESRKKVMAATMSCDRRET